MAKAQPAPPKASTSNLAAAAPNKRALSELDDIFAKRPKVTPTTVVAPAVEHKAAKGKGKGKAKVDEAAASVKKAPVEIVDTSASIIAYRPEAAPTKRKAGGEGGGDGAGVGKEEEEEDRFMDSRGTNRRRTDDGLAIYAIEELKIGLGGDSPDCPFDCQCCF